MASLPELDESAFENACKELDEPDIEAWEFFVESHDVKIYRNYNEVSGLYQYKIYGNMKDVQPDICAQVYMDLDYRKTWDSYVNELSETEVDDKKIVYWQVNFPWPMSNRDYVYEREFREMDRHGNHIWLVMCQHHSVPVIPEKSGVVRVSEYISHAALMSDGNGGTKAYMRYYDNPGGSIPTWLINWGAKTGVPQFLSQMETACRGYTKYLETKQQETVSL